MNDAWRNRAPWPERDNVINSDVHARGKKVFRCLKEILSPMIFRGYESLNNGLCNDFVFALHTRFDSVLFYHERISWTCHYWKSITSRGIHRNEMVWDSLIFLPLAHNLPQKFLVVRITRLQKFITTLETPDVKSHRQWSSRPVSNLLRRTWWSLP